MLADFIYVSYFIQDGHGNNNRILVGRQNKTYK